MAWTVESDISMTSKSRLVVGAKDGVSDGSREMYVLGDIVSFSLAALELLFLVIAKAAPTVARPPKRRPNENACQVERPILVLFSLDGLELGS